MDQLPVELLCMIGENLTSYDLSSFSRTSRTYWQRLEPLLYRLHALRETRRAGSAVVQAIEFADPNKPETQAMSLITLDKVARFCQLESADLGRCRPAHRAYCWLDTSRVGRFNNIAFLGRTWVRLVHCPSLSPLHVAALKGLDDIAAWLLSQGASVDAPIPGSKTTALSLAILGNRTPTALILLANGADPDLRESDQDPPTVLHLACALGLTELTDRLLTGRYVEAHPTELLAVYHLHCPSDVPRLAAGLVRRGAEVSEDIVGAFLRGSRWQSAWELLMSPMLRDHLTAEGASSILRTVLSLRGGELANHVGTAVRMLQHLLNFGADPDLGRLLWRQSGGVSYPTWLKLLPPLLEAGMDVKPALSKRRRAPRQRPAKYGVDDLLGHTSPYDKSQDDEGAAAQLAIIHLLLQHGAPIGKATRGDALDSYLLGSGQELHGRARWSYKLSRVLLGHCNNTPEDMRGEDIKAFLSRHSEVQGRTRGTLVDGL
ncbi:hypothetical protein S40288_09763 [Stachybotrys chartarum IBT 40288]|nr:hypothetical protein S40288_09763 [Stachybotrys chartarum IBT 40288]